jgi:ferritin-like metal-binding protein YciE
MKLKTLHDLYIEELRDLYSAEKQIIKALPRMAKASSSPDLKAAFQEHLTQTEGHLQRLETLFETLGKKPTGKTCKAMEGLVAEGEELISEKPEPEVLDAGLISAAQRVEHYEIAGYGSVRTYAETLGQSDAARLLQRTLDEEAATDKKLTSLAESYLNARAKAGASH